MDLKYINKIEEADVYGNASQERSVAVLGDGTMRVVYDLWFFPT